MTELASLSIAIDSSPVGRARALVDELTAAGGKSEEQIKRLASAQGALNFQLNAQQSMSESAAKIKARTDATAALVKRIQDQIDVEKQAEATASATGGMIEGLILKYVSWTAAIAAVVSVLKQMWSQGHEAAVVELRLDATLRAVGATSGRTADQLNKLAEALSATTRFDDTAIKQGMMTMLKFSSVHSDTFDEAIKVTAKYAEMSGQSFEGSAQQIGRALEAIASGRGSGGLRGLEEQFGKLTSTQRNYIDEQVKLGEVTTAQIYLLDIMNKKLGDIDTEMAGAGVNSVSMFKKAWKELMEELGKPSKEGGVLDWFINKGAQSIANWARVIKDDGGVGAEGKQRADLEWMIERGKTAEPKGTGYDAHYAKIIDQAVAAREQLTKLNNDALDKQIERDLIEGSKRDAVEEKATKESARRSEELKAEEWKKGAAKRVALQQKEWDNNAKNDAALTKMVQEGVQAQASAELKLFEDNEKLRAADLKGVEAGIVARYEATQAAGIAEGQIRLQQLTKIAAEEKKANEDRLREQKRLAEDVDRMLGDAIMRGFERGTDFAKNFRDTLVNMFKTLVLRPVISWVLSPITGAIGATLAGMGVSGAANAAGGIGGLNSIGTLGNLYSSGSSLMSMGVAGVADYAAGFATTATASQAASAAMIESGTAGWAGSGMEAGAGAMGFSAAIPYVGAAALALYALGAFDGEGDAQRKGNWSGSLGAVGGSTNNQWFGNDMISTMDTFSKSLAATEQNIITTQKLNSTQIDIINTKLSSLAGREYGFGMEHTDWTQSGAGAAIASDRMKVIAETLGTTIEGLAQKVSDAQKVIELAPQKRQMEIALMEAQGKAVEALAAKREDELASLNATLHPLQKMIYLVSDFAIRLQEAAAVAKDYVSEQTKSVQDAAQTAHGASEEYRQLSITLSEAAHQLRGRGALSALTPSQQYAEAGANASSVFQRALTKDATAIEKLPQAIEAWLTLSRTMNSSSAAYTTDFSLGQDMLSQAQAVSASAAIEQDHTALVMDAQLVALNAIGSELSKPSPDAAILTEQARILGTISLYSDAQLREIVSSGMMQDSNLSGINTGTIKIISLLEQWVALQGQSLDAANQAAEAQIVAAVDIASAAKAAADAAANAAQQQVTTAIIAETARTNAIGMPLFPSHASGLYSVPYDGYTASLHRDEAVLTSAQASGWRSGSQGITSEDLRALRADVQRLTAIVEAGDHANVQATERVATSQENAAWRAEVKPSLK